MTGNSTFSGTITAPTFIGDLNGTINTLTTAVTQSANNNSTKVATTAYVDTSAGLYLPLAGGTLTGNLGINGSPTTNYPLTLRSKSGDYTKILDWGTDVGGSWGTMQIAQSAPYATELRSGAWNFAQGYVGLNTTNADTYALGVTGSGIAINSTSASVGSIISLETAGVKRGYLFANASNVVLSAVHTGVPLKFNTEDTLALTIDTSQNSTFAGKVYSNDSIKSTGFGVAPTGAGAEMLFTSGISLYQSYDRDNSVYLPVKLDGSTVDLQISGVPKLTIDSSGNVGIGGTPSTFSNFTNVTIQGGSSGSNLDFKNSSGARVSAIVTTASNELIIETGTAQPILFKTNDAERMRIDSSGNVGIGDDTPTSKLTVLGTSTAASNTPSNAIFDIQGTSTAHLLMGVANVSPFGAWINTDGTGQPLVLMGTGGNVGIGTISPAVNLQVENASDTTIALSNSASLTSGNRGNIAFFNSDVSTVATIRAGAVTDNVGTDLQFYTRPAAGLLTERMRITSAGYLLASNTGTYYGVTNLYHQLVQTTGDQWSTIISNSTTLPYGLYIRYVFSSPNNANHQFLYCADSSALRFYVNSNGGIGNFSSNNVNISDERVKNNIENSGDYLNKICSIPVRLFNYKDEKEGTPKNLGVIAQEVEAVAPELVSNDGFGETPEDGIPLKSVYSTDMMYAMMKSIQELTAKVEMLEKNCNCK